MTSFFRFKDGLLVYCWIIAAQLDVFRASVLDSGSAGHMKCPAQQCFPNGVLTCGRGDKFGQNDQKLHENYKINILGENWSDIGTQANFGGSGRDWAIPHQGKHQYLCPVFFFGTARINFLTFLHKFRVSINLKCDGARFFEEILFQGFWVKLDQYGPKGAHNEVFQVL